MRNGSRLDAVQRYEAALAATDDAATADAVVIRAGVERFRELFGDFTADGVRGRARTTYAATAWFDDTLKTVEGAGAIESYLAESAEATARCTVRITDVSGSGIDRYVRWVMEIEFAKFRRGTSCPSMGITHLRFDAEGRILLHQDYWDAAGGLYEHLPLIGRFVRMVRRRV